MGVSVKVAVLVSGGGTNLQAMLDRIDEKKLTGVEISVVIASNSKAYALERAKKKQIPTAVISKKAYTSLEAYDEAMLMSLQDFGAELVVAAGFLSMVGARVLRYYENRVINVHPSLIPSFCGKGMYGIKPHEAAIEKGVKISGATVHFLNEVYDEGPILHQKAVEVFPEDTPETLQERIMTECEQVILPEAIQWIADGRVKIENGRVVIEK